MPPGLRDGARDLYRILARERESAREFETLKPLAARAAWLAVPLDYPRFWSKAGTESGRRTVIHEQEHWRQSLARSLQAVTDVLPVIPRYEDFPYVIALGAPDPAGMDRVFDDRYFMASSELNLLNALLLHGPGGEDSSPAAK